MVSDKTKIRTLNIIWNGSIWLSTYHWQLNNNQTKFYYFFSVHTCKYVYLTICIWEYMRSRWSQFGMTSMLVHIWTRSWRFWEWYFTCTTQGEKQNKIKQGDLSPKDQIKQEINKPSQITQQITYTNTQTSGMKFITRWNVSH